MSANEYMETMIFLENMETYLGMRRDEEEVLLIDSGKMRALLKHVKNLEYALADVLRSHYEHKRTFLEAQSR